MSSGAELTSHHGDWAEIQRVLALKRGRRWHEDLPEDDLVLLSGSGAIWFRYGEDLLYGRRTATNHIYEVRMEAKTVLVSVFDSDGELEAALSFARDAFQLVELDEHEDHN